MNHREDLQAEIVTWLSEVGVHDADARTGISSLNLTWVLHRFEETTGRTLALGDQETVRGATVSALADVLHRAAGGGDR